MKASRTFAACVLVGLLVPAPARAQVTAVTVRVDGLSCAFCAYSLEKRLKAVEGVHELTIDVSEGTATFAPRDETPIDFEALPDAVIKAGFTPREIHAAGVGRIALVAEQPTLVDLDGRPLFHLESNDALKQLHPDSGVALDFTGTVLLPNAGNTPALRTLALTAASARAGRGEG